MRHAKGGRVRRGYRDRDEDYESYDRYNEIEDEGYERAGYSRSSGPYQMSGLDDYRDEEGYHDEDVRGRHENRRGLAGLDLDEEEQRPLRASRRQESGRRTSRSDEDEFDELLSRELERDRRASYRQNFSDTKEEERRRFSARGGRASQGDRQIGRREGNRSRHSYSSSRGH